jgi:hypothetical protein
MRILRRLGSPDGRIEPPKPRWMHWSTYYRELARAVAYSDASWERVLHGILAG